MKLLINSSLQHLCLTKPLFCHPHPHQCSVSWGEEETSPAQQSLSHGATDSTLYPHGLPSPVPIPKKLVFLTHPVPAPHISDTSNDNWCISRPILVTWKSCYHDAQSAFDDPSNPVEPKGRHKQLAATGRSLLWIQQQMLRCHS